MWLKCLMVGTVFATSLLSISAQVLTKNGRLTVTNLTPGTTNLLVLNAQAGKVRALPPAVNRGAETNFQTAAQPGCAKGNSRDCPAPGVYKTEPFACIVLVPDKRIDEAIA